MKKIVLIFAVALTAFSAVSCSDLFELKVVRGSGVYAEQVYDVDDFSSISVSGSCDVYFTQGPKSVTLTADDNTIEYYRIETEARTLEISSKRGVIIQPKAKTFLTASSPEFSGLKISGSGDCIMKSPVHTDDDFTISITGSGDVEASRIECKDFNSTISGSGNIEAGSIDCDEFSLKVTGSGDLEVESLAADNITITITGSGDVTIGCDNVDNITVHIMGSGDVKLYGSAKSLDIKITGSGDIDSSQLNLD